MPILDRFNNRKTIIGYIQPSHYEIFENFDIFWEAVLKDGKLGTGKHYRNHHATWYGPVDYSYTGVTHSKQKMPDNIAQIARDLEQELNKPDNYFNSVLINLYINKGIARHSDDEPIFRNAQGDIGAVATISLGAPATVIVTPKYPAINPNTEEEEEEHVFTVLNESLYIMPSGDFQDRYWHQVTPSDGRRISLTFRHIPKWNE